MPRPGEGQLAASERFASKGVVAFLQNPNLLRYSVSEFHTLILWMQKQKAHLCHTESCHNLVYLEGGIPWYHLLMKLSTKILYQPIAFLVFFAMTNEFLSCLAHCILYTFSATIKDVVIGNLDRRITLSVAVTLCVNLTLPYVLCVSQDKGTWRNQYKWGLMIVQVSITIPSQ